MKFLLVISLTFLIYCSSEAQNLKATINGSVLSSQLNRPIESSTIIISDVSDTVKTFITSSSKNGNFKFGNLPFGKYILKIKSIGYQSVTKEFTFEQPVVNLPPIILLSANVDLKEVNIKGVSTPVKVRRDTVEFNASSYKTQANDNVEQLLKKLPGVDVDQSGKITAQGKTVNKVLVEGKEFFGNDPKAATKNLPADAISKVQIIDDKSEKTKNSGIDDGQRNKVINLTLKDDKKKGWFGNAAIEGGTHERYLTQLNANHFNNKQQFSILLLSNNINETGFSLEDLNNFAGGNAFNAFSSGNGSNSINVSSSGRININGAFSGVNGGLITNHSGGINFSDEIGKRSQLKYNISFVAVSSKNFLTQNSDISDPISSGYLFTRQQLVGHNNLDNYRLNLNLDYKADSLTTIKFKPVLSISNKSNNSLTTGIITNNTNLTTNESQDFNQTINSQAFGGQASINRRLHNNKGSISWFLTGNYAPTNTVFYNNLLIVRTQNAQPTTDSASNSKTNQDLNSRFLNSTISLVRQLSRKKKVNLTISQNILLRKEETNQLALEYNAVNGRYDLLIPQNSGVFDNDNWRYSGTLGLSKTSTKFNSSINLELADIGLNGTSNQLSSPIRKDEFAVVPSAILSYQGTKGDNFFISIKSDVALPSVYDLQPILNNTNPLYIKVGNPNLNTSRNLTVNSSYSNFNSNNNSYLNVNLNFTSYFNGFSTENTVNDQLIQTIKPINVNGNYAGQLDVSSGKPTHITGLKYSYGFGGFIYNSINVINGSRNNVFRITPNVNLGLNYDRNSLSLSFKTTNTFNSVKNSFQKIANTSYYLITNNYKASWEPIAGFRIFSDLYQNNYLGQKLIPNTSLYLLSSGIEKFFSKSRLFSATLGGFDILDQNSGLQRTIYSTGRIEAYQSNTIGRYFYFKLNYKLNKLGSKNSSNGTIRKL